MRLTGLADACRAAGLPVVEVAGWQARGEDLGTVRAVLAHHTATGTNWTNAAVDRLLVNGRPDLPGPLCQIGLDRQGRVRLIAAGRANHAGKGAWNGATGNTSAVGVEAYNDGREPWPAIQLAAWDRLNAVLLRTLGLPASALCGHKEWAPARKVDPHTLSMDAMRARAGALLTEEDDVPSAREIADEVWNARRTHGPKAAENTPGDVLWATLDSVHGLGRMLAAVPAAVKASVADLGADVDTDALAAKIVTRLAEKAGQ